MSEEMLERIENKLDFLISREQQMVMGSSCSRMISGQEIYEDWLNQESN